MALEASPQDWIGVVKWLYQHIDGPAVQRLSHEGTGEGGAIVVANVELTDAERRAALAGMFGLSTETDG